MGRSKHEFLAGALSMYPIPLVRDNAATTASGPKGTYPMAPGPFASAKPENYERKSPFSAAPLDPPDSDHVRYVRSPHLMGYTWSAELITEVTDTQIALGTKNDGAGITLTDRAITDVAAGTNPTGFVRGTFDAGDGTLGPSLRARDAAGAALDDPGLNQGFGLRSLGSTSDVINGLGGNSFGCPSAIYDGANNVYAAGGPHAQSNSWGNMVGAMTTFVLHDASLASGQSATVIRKFRAPFAMRVLNITFGCAGSGASNLVRLDNATQGTQINTNKQLDAAGSVSIDADGAVFQLPNRDIEYNDVLDLVATTSGTGFTNLWCMVTCTVKGNAYGGTDNARTWSWRNVNSAADPTAAIAGSFTHGPTRHSSGPVIGAPIALYIGGQDSGTSQTNEALQEIVAPFDMDVYHVAVWSHSSIAANTTKVRNTTQAADIIAHLAVSTDDPNTTDTQGNGTFAITTQRVNRGDVLTVTVTTGLTATTFAGATLLGIARGFPYANAALD